MNAAQRSIRDKISRLQADALIASSLEPCSRYAAGCRAFRAGVVVGDNPHDETTEAHWEWMRGWVDAGLIALNRKSHNAAPACSAIRLRKGCYVTCSPHQRHLCRRVEKKLCDKYKSPNISGEGRAT